MKRKVLYISLVGLISFFAINVMAQVTSYPYTQNFDSWTVSGGVGCGGTVTLEEGWTNLTGDDFDWDIEVDNTTYQPTGPDGDHTSGEGNYLYTEATSCHNSVAEITSPVFDLTAVGAPVTPEIRFWYHMYGADMGVLEVFLSDDGGITWTSSNVWSQAGDNGNEWKEISIDISSYVTETDFMVKFVGTTGDGYLSDMAIDDFSIDEPGYLIYCESVYTNSSTLYVQNVTLNTINNTSYGEGYGDFTAISTDLATESEYTLSIACVNFADPYVSQIWAWFDWNQDGDFDDIGEAYDLGETAGFPNIYYFDESVTVPVDAALGSTRMRLILKKHLTEDPLPCEGGTNGETEDYTVNVVVPTAINWLGGTSTDWATGLNWEGGSVPDETVDVVIGSGATYYPYITGGDFYINDDGGAYNCKKMTITSGGEITTDPDDAVKVYGDLTIETGGVFYVGDNFSLNGDGNLYILGGTLANNVDNAIGDGDFYFNNGGGYMTHGTLTVFNTFNIDVNCKWYASGGTVHFGGINRRVQLQNNSDYFDLNNLVVDEDVKADVLGSSLKKVNVNGDFTLSPGSQFTLIAPIAGQNISAIEVGGTFSMEANTAKTASLVNHGTLTTAATLDIQKYVTADRWHYFSSPVSSETANMFLGMYLYSFDESTYDPGPPATGGWENIVVETTPIDVGVGYKVWSFSPSPGSATVSFTNGTLNNGTYSLPVYATDQDASTTIGDGEGWSYVGNPYPSAIDWDDASWMKTNLTGSIYLYDGAQYLSWNGSMGGITDGIIPSMQSFFVKANDFSPALQVTNDARVHGAAAYKATTVLANTLQLTVTGNELEDNTYVSFNVVATEAFDDQHDAYKLMGSDQAPQLYSMGDVLYSINTQPALSNDVSIPLGFKVGAEGIYKIMPSEGFSFEPGVEIYLEDLKEGALIDLNVQKKYSFFASPDDSEARFILHFYPSVVGIENGIESNNTGFVIYSNDQSVFVNNTEGTPCDIFVYDITGREITAKANSIDTYVELRLNEGTGFYVVRVRTESGMISEKVFIK